MLISTEPFRKYVKIISSFQEKGNQIFESLYFDLKNSRVGFKSTSGIGILRISITPEDGDDLTNFFVSGSKFLGLVSDYPSLKLDNNYVFSSGKDKFNFGFFQDEESCPIDDSKFNNRGEFVQFSPVDFEQISNASSFIDDEQPAYKGLFLKDNSIIGMNLATPAYIASLDFDAEKSLSSTVVGLLLALGQGTNINFGAKSYLVSNEDLTIMIPYNNNLSAPPFCDPGFISSYTHPDFIKFNQNIFSSSVDFISKYFSETINSKISFVVGDDGSFKVRITDPIKNFLIEKEIPIEECSEDLKGTQILISGVKVKKCIKLFSNCKTIQFNINLSKPVVTLSSEEDPQKKILIARIKENN